MSPKRSSEFLIENYLQLSSKLDKVMCQSNSSIILESVVYVGAVHKRTVGLVHKKIICMYIVSVLIGSRSGLKK